MLDISTIEDVLRSWVIQVTTLETIFTPTFGPRPALPYVIIDVSQALQVGLEEHVNTLLGDDSIDIDYSTVNDIFLSINAYGDGSFTLATKLKDSLNRITISELLFAGGLGFHRAGAVNEMPDVVNKEYENRAQFDCFFFIRSSDSENINNIRQIEITNELDDSTTVVKHPDIP